MVLAFNRVKSLLIACNPRLYIIYLKLKLAY